jgi:hypothetical protein
VGRGRAQIYKGGFAAVEIFFELLHHDVDVLLVTLSP